MNSKTTNPLMNNNSKEENKMEMFVGVVLPILLIVIANKLQSDYKIRREEKAYKDQVAKFASDVIKEIKLNLPKGE